MEEKREGGELKVKEMSEMENGRSKECKGKRRVIDRNDKGSSGIREIDRET